MALKEGGVARVRLLRDLDEGDVHGAGAGFLGCRDVLANDLAISAELDASVVSLQASSRQSTENYGEPLE